jgi:hypothetical protein
MSAPLCDPDGLSKLALPAMLYLDDLLEQVNVDALHTRTLF